MQILIDAGFALEGVGGNLTAWMRHLSRDRALQITEAFDIPAAPRENGPCFVCLIDPEEDPTDTPYAEVRNFAEAITTADDLVARYGA